MAVWNFRNMKEHQHVRRISSVYSNSQITRYFSCLMNFVQKNSQQNRQICFSYKSRFVFHWILVLANVISTRTLVLDSLDIRKMENKIRKIDRWLSGMSSRTCAATCSHLWVFDCLILCFGTLHFETKWCQRCTIFPSTSKCVFSWLDQISIPVHESCDIGRRQLMQPLLLTHTCARRSCFKIQTDQNEFRKHDSATKSERVGQEF